MARSVKYLEVLIGHVTTAQAFSKAMGGAQGITASIVFLLTN